MKCRTEMLSIGLSVRLFEEENYCEQNIFHYRQSGPLRQGADSAHHAAIVSTALTVEDIRLFAKMTDTELVIIDDKT